MDRVWNLAKNQSYHVTEPLTKADATKATRGCVFSFGALILFFFSCKGYEKDKNEAILFVFNINF